MVRFALERCFEFEFLFIQTETVHSALELRRAPEPDHAVCGAGDQRAVILGYEVSHVSLGVEHADELHRLQVARGPRSLALAAL